MTDLALDMSVEALTPEPAPQRIDWRSRRREGFGASDVPALLILYGYRAAESAPRYLADKAARMVRHAGHPRLLLEKAGIVSPTKGSGASVLGTQRERELLDTWAVTKAHELGIDASTVRHASSIPEEWLPLASLTESWLHVTPDAWARDDIGSLVNVELKCSRSDVFECTWWWRAQCEAQRMVTRADYSVLVAGSRWARDDMADGEIRHFVVEPDEELCEQIRTVVSKAQYDVFKIKKERGK